MATPLLTTKLYIPPVRPELVPRPRLTERLNAGLQRKLTLVSAPAGFGKTTLLSEWMHSRGEVTSPLPVAWVSLDKGDNDPARFWAYFVAALQTIPSLSAAAVGQSVLVTLQTPQSSPIESLLTGLINEIAETQDPPSAGSLRRSLSRAQPRGSGQAGHGFALVLDDFHLITEQQIHDGLTFLVDNLPPQMHLILSSRADPPWPLARLRARGEMTELRTGDLRFAPEEAAAFLNDVMGLNISPEDVTALEARTEGWIAGLQMAALSMRGRKDVSGFIKAFSGSHRFILDYLVEEVLDRQSSDIQEFLLKTSILERMTAPLCDAMTGRDDSQPILAQLEQANLFLVALDDERRWYRYHHLFADVLSQCLRDKESELIPELHRRAAEWYEQNGLIDEAIEHTLAAEDFERVACLIEQRAMHMFIHGEMATLLKWLEVLPDDLIPERPWLCIFHAWALHLGVRAGVVEPRLKDAERALEKRALPEAEVHHMLSHIATIRALEALVKEDVPRAKELAHQALKYRPEENFVRGLSAQVMGWASRLSGDLAAAQQAFTEARALSLTSGSTYVAVSATCRIA